MATEVPFMHEQYSMPLSAVIDNFKLEPIYLPREADGIMLSNPEVNRPGLALTGFFERFENTRQTSQ